MGGMDGFGSVVVPGSDAAWHEPWELRVFALSTIAGIDGLGAGSGRAIREEMDPVSYLAASYYERWLWSTEQRLLRKGTIREGEVDAWVQRLRRGESPPTSEDPAHAARLVAATRAGEPMRPAEEACFGVGDVVRVRRMRPAGHTRCPRYVRGATGHVEAVRGTDALPDHGPESGSPDTVYAVAFGSDELFGVSPDGAWTVVLDLFERYLEAA